MERPMRIAMWSGPRNLSTAMMYAFGNRADCAVVDEPFYATYLADTGLNHPMRTEILTSQPQDPTVVADKLVTEMPEGRPVYYQKHMTQHMTTVVPRRWMEDCVNVFLLRHPARVVASYAAKRENPVLEDLGFVQQAELFDHVCDLGQTPVVIDSYDIRQKPEVMLRKLCETIGLPFDPAMLGWPSGGHRADGIWASHWYGAVHNSTGFAGPEGPLPSLSGPLAEVAESALPAYEKMAAQKLRPE